MGGHGQPGLRLLNSLSHQSFPTQLSVSPEQLPILILLLVLFQQWTVLEKKRDFFCQPGFLNYVLPLHPGLYGVGCLPPLAQPHDGLVQPQHLPPCPRHFHFLSLPNFTEGPLPYAFFEYFFTTQSASITALSIICSTRSGSWRDVFFKISFSIPYPPPRPSAVHILSSQTVYRTEKQCR